MSDTETIFAKYRDSKPTNVQSLPRSLQRLHKDFLLYVKGHSEQARDTVAVDHLQDATDAQKLFYREALVTLLHPIYGQLSEAHYGPANVQLFKLRRDGGTHRLEMYSQNRGQTLIDVSDSDIVLTDNKLQLTSNNGYQVSLERTSEQFDVNQFVAADADLHTVYRLTVTKNGRLSMRVNLVALTM